MGGAMVGRFCWGGGGGGMGIVTFCEKNDYFGYISNIILVW